MKLTLLVKGEKDKQILEGCERSDGVICVSQRYLSSDNLYCVVFEVEGTSIEAAKKLANHRDAIVGLVDSRILDDDVSERFERDLYSEVCKFERNLRKLITLCACGEKDSLEHELVEKLESLTFGSLFDELFVDNEFNVSVKKLVDSKSKRCEKSELINRISEFEENSVWNELFSDGEMPTIVSEHREIQSLRNDVMHSHTMGYKRYDWGKKLMKNVNKEIDDAVSRRTGAKVEASAGVVESLLGSIAAVQDDGKAVNHYTIEDAVEKIKAAVSMYESMPLVIEGLTAVSSPSRGQTAEARLASRSDEDGISR